MLSTSPNGGDDYKKKKKENKRRERLIWNACYISPPCHQGNKEMKTRPFFFYITHIFIFYSVFSKEDEKKMSIGKYYSRSDKKNKKKKKAITAAHTPPSTHVSFKQ